QARSGGPRGAGQAPAGQTRMMVWLYRVLLLAFPARVRRQFGDDMVRMFERQLDEARRNGESAVRLLVDAAADAFVQGTDERLTIANEARVAAIRELGRWRCWMHAFRQDLRYGLRRLAAQPAV